MKKKAFGESIIIPGPYRRAAAQIVDGMDAYKGLHIHALPGLHQHLADLIKEHVGCSGSALDLGAGSGAFVSRLKDLGFAATAIDYVAENFQLHDAIDFVQADLNGLFSEAVDDRFDLVTAVEIIEHLENPRNFLREAAKLCEPREGKIILTTPNTDSPVSKAIFCRFGTHMWFSDGDYENQGHITPLSRWQVRKIADENNFHVLYEGSFGDPCRKLGRWSRMRYFARLIQTVSKVEPHLSGEVYVAVLGSRS